MNRKPRQTPHLPGSQIFYVILHFLQYILYWGYLLNLTYYLPYSEVGNRHAERLGLRPFGLQGFGFPVPTRTQSTKAAVSGSVWHPNLRDYL